MKNVTLYYHLSFSYYVHEVITSNQFN